MDPRHRNRHDLGREERRREAVAYMFSLPEAGLAGYLHTWVNGAGRAGSAVFLYGPGVENDLLEILVNGVDLPPEADFDDWNVGDVHLRQRPDDTMTAEVRSDRLELDLAFDPMHPPYLYSANEANGGKPLPAYIADDRFEQSGIMTGELRFEGQVIPFRTQGHRHHTWGSRYWGIADHWKWFHAQAGTSAEGRSTAGTPGGELAVHFMEIQALGERIVRGYVWRDGELADVTDVDIAYLYDHNFWHTDATAVVHDSLGRSTTVRGSVFARYTMNPHPMSKNHEGALEVTIEGEPGVGHLEMQWLKHHLDYLQQQPYIKASARGTSRARGHQLAG
jgi:hypothetical protein